MFNRASPTGRVPELAPTGEVVAETIERGFDRGSAAAGAGVGAGGTLVLVALVAGVRGRRTGSHHRGGSQS